MSTIEHVEYSTRNETNWRLGGMRYRLIHLVMALGIAGLAIYLLILDGEYYFFSGMRTASIFALFCIGYAIGVLLSTAANSCLLLWGCVLASIFTILAGYVACCFIVLLGLWRFLFALLLLIVVKLHIIFSLVDLRCPICFIPWRRTTRVTVPGVIEAVVVFVAGRWQEEFLLQVQAVLGVVGSAGYHRRMAALVSSFQQKQQTCQDPERRQLQGQTISCCFLSEIHAHFDQYSYSLESRHAILKHLDVLIHNPELSSIFHELHDDFCASIQRLKLDS
ncbi:hypothetical protein Ciccas_004980 [Cichlidogyrus casuarinus]|uniref:Uncharacterized protein n=1 Tax=Cichlidogyrus casuarinus TaxID=1844966 RepID=A0ABD2Q9Z4_9PLAT